MTTRQATGNELAHDAVSLRHVLGEGFISNGPLASVTVALAAAAAFGAGALPLTVLLGALIALTWINTPYQFSAGGFVYVAFRIRGRRRVALPSEPVQLGSLDVEDLVSGRVDAEESSRSGTR